VGSIFKLTQRDPSADTGTLDPSNKPVRWLAEGRDASATLDAANGDLGVNEITGVLVSDGNPTYEVLLSDARERRQHAPRPGPGAAGAWAAASVCASGRTEGSGESSVQRPQSLPECILRERSARPGGASHGYRNRQVVQ
jgi:hypothetical protein